MFFFWKIKIGGVHLIEGFPNNAIRQRPEHCSFTTAARRQTAPPHHTHNFCWHGPRQRSHGEGNRYLYQLVVTGATSGVELWRRRYNPQGDGCYLSTDRLRMCNMYQQLFYCCCCLSFSPSLSVCAFVQGYLTQQFRHFSTCPFIFSQLQRSVCTNGIYSLLPQHRYRLRMCTMYQ